MTLSGSGNVGIGVTDPDSKLEILDTTAPQLKLSYDGSKFANFDVSSDGDLVIDANGNDITLSERTDISFGVSS